MTTAVEWQEHSCKLILTRSCTFGWKAYSPSYSPRWTQLYTKYLVMERGNAVLYVQLGKVLYGTMSASWKDLSGHPYDGCVMNKTANRTQCMVLWHVYDLKISNVDSQTGNCIKLILCEGQSRTPNIPILLQGPGLAVQADLTSTFVTLEIRQAICWMAEPSPFHLETSLCSKLISIIDGREEIC